jgi:hypothetical protein
MLRYRELRPRDGPVAPQVACEGAEAEQIIALDDTPVRVNQRGALGALLADWRIEEGERWTLNTRHTSANHMQSVGILVIRSTLAANLVWIGALKLRQRVWLMPLDTSRFGLLGRGPDPDGRLQ